MNSLDLWYIYKLMELICQEVDGGQHLVRKNGHVQGENP